MLYLKHGTVRRQIQEVDTFYGTQMFIPVFAKSSHWPYPKPVESSPHPAILHPSNTC
jgi:hypothetical protein